jgi:hypothetical protein
LLKKSRPARTNVRHGRFLPKLEPLAERVTPAVTAIFSPGAHTLSVFGDAAGNMITISRDAAELRRLRATGQRDFPPAVAGRE